MPPAQGDDDDLEVQQEQEQVVEVESEFGRTLPEHNLQKGKGDNAASCGPLVGRGPTTGCVVQSPPGWGPGSNQLDGARKKEEEDTSKMETGGGQALPEHNFQKGEGDNAASCGPLLGGGPTTGCMVQSPPGRGPCSKQHDGARNDEEKEERGGEDTTRKKNRQPEALRADAVLREGLEKLRVAAPKNLKASREGCHLSIARLEQHSKSGSKTSVLVSAAHAAQLLYTCEMGTKAAKYPKVVAIVVETFGKVVACGIFGQREVTVGGGLAAATCRNSLHALTA